MFISLYVAKIMHGMQYCSVPTSMLVVFKLVKTLISVKMYGLHSTSVVHRFVKRKLVAKHTKTDFVKSMH